MGKVKYDSRSWSHWQNSLRAYDNGAAHRQMENRDRRLARKRKR
jgi:hypothetical protein